ncbi:hypothetical protein EJO69_09200 [Flaviflexus salsibiostraticola]|uniref:Uncharacterized protein n=1 Tax=Flaviflexus salsibiostraticola TaxID=1282737 RepID=A0A3Q8WU87_9ACTO|nr:hypothetical protein [Flaviflexus salsibiostraticola]AZN30462.1 hypothetical protein EJO69_09200 [Flaviflexus salsibiostraticola]
MENWKLTYDGKEYWVTKEAAQELRDADTSGEAGPAWFGVRTSAERWLHIRLTHGVGMTLEEF